jgi:hypothetical protein
MNCVTSGISVLMAACLTVAYGGSDPVPIYYFDGQEIRRIENEICHEESPVRLSLAIIRWPGPVTDAIDGKSMDVDWVRVWQQTPKAR